MITDSNRFRLVLEKNNFGHCVVTICIHKLYYYYFLTLGTYDHDGDEKLRK